MAFKATNILPQHGYNQARNIALGIKNYCQNKSAQITASGLNGNDILGILTTLSQNSADLNALKTIAGIAQFARDQEDDQAYDVVAEFNALVALVDTAIANLAAAIPQEGSGYLLILKLSGNAADWRTFTAGQLASLKSDLDAIAAAVS